MIFSLTYFAFYFSLFVIILWLWKFNRKPAALPAATPASEKPFISILIAARNEEHNIIRCLSAIQQLNYPPEKVEVLIGDDGSTDATAQLVQEFIAGKPQFRLLAIPQEFSRTKGKANVLAHLTKAAASDYFFITDADITVPPGWVEEMLAQLQPETGIVTGVTTIAGNSLFGRLQALDWLYALGLVQVVSDLGLAVTTMGNNMLLRRQAYESVGGYENIPFSVTEDVALFKAVILKGWKSRNVFSRNVLAFSEPAQSLVALLHQRKRWMRGSMHLPFYMLVVFVLHASYYPIFLPFLAYVPWPVYVGVFGVKLLLQSAFVRICGNRLKIETPLWLLVLLEFYLIYTSIILILFFFLPLGVKWKNRRF